ncbi:MAG: quinolinate synthase NadA [Lachnospiraceae bacterium]
MKEKIDRIQHLKQEKDAVIMAHYYVREEVQEVADYIGDSYFLSELATRVPQKTIVLCGVSFMGESAKILNPQKVVLLPEPEADCPMAHMADVEKIRQMREKYEDLAVVCYVNSTAELKMHSDVCVTSSNALKIVTSLPNKNIFFIPDENLGRFVAQQLPDKNVILNDGYCHVHTNITREAILKTKAARPNAQVLVHPECREEVVQLADYVGSTAGIIAYATQSEQKEFIVATEMGILHMLQKNNPDKRFYVAGSQQVCPNMKKITLDKIINALETAHGAVTMDEEDRTKAHDPMLRMLKLS